MGNNNVRLILYLLVLDFVLIIYANELAMRIRWDAMLFTLEPPLLHAQSPRPATGAVEQSLGGEIFEKATNPLKDKLPNTNPVENANPIEGLYKNPFN